jgi:PhnB protein
MKRLNPYINFGGKAREAMTFYRDTLGGELSLMTIGESPVPCEDNKDAKDAIMHSSLEGGNFSLMGTDMGDPAEAGKQGSIAICADCSSEEEVRRLYDALSAGGKVEHPLNEAFWGGLFGVLQDKYGIVWMLNYAKG